MKREIELPRDLHPDTVDLVVKFAEAIADKLRRAEIKYDFTNEWKTDTCWRDKCMDDLLEHLAKGDPRDVAIYCAFMWHHHWKTSVRSVVIP